MLPRGALKIICLDQTKSTTLHNDRGTMTTDRPFTRYLVGEVFETLRLIPDNSVDLVLTSPPFLALRSYLPLDHPLKHQEIGNEATPCIFIDTLLDLTEELARVLTPHGSLVVELGDTYSGSGGAGGDYAVEGIREGQPTYRQARNAGWPQAKSLCLVPELYRVALSYGRNPLSERQTPRWRVRNVVRWHRPNPPVGALGDKFRPSTSDMVIATKSKDRYFDSEGARDEGATSPSLDTWIIPTKAYKEAHYATFPEALVEKPILGMCPLRVCVVCGLPSTRLVEPLHDKAYNEQRRKLVPPKGPNNSRADQGSRDFQSARYKTVGWSDCGHDHWRAGVVLDPFAGSGTTLAVAAKFGRSAIGIDIDERNLEFARRRKLLGMFLEDSWPHEK